MPAPVPADRILVDLLGFTGSRGGTETYARELLVRLPALLPDATFAALTGRVGAERVRGFFPGAVHALPWVRDDAVSWAVGAVAGTELFARRNGADLVWAPANFGPVFRGTPRVVTVHDAIYDEVRGSVGERVMRAATSTLMRRSATTADRVITVSRSAATAIRTHLGVAPDRISVVHNGSRDPRPQPDPRATVARLRLPANRPILLSTGNRMPHKNFEGLLAAIAEIPRDRRPVAVIAGGREGDPLRATVDRLGLEDDVILPGWVSDEELEALYQVADLYVCPSLAEGFGLPVVDAMRREVPVLAHDIPVLREVGGDAARYSDARSPRTFAAAIVAALQTAPGEAQRREAADWAARFTWDAAAQGTAAVLTEIIRSRRNTP
ncbi:glycosyltransferase family 4 protein [Microbacterium sp. P07]|uniref:glycosyltransferase family 4 protein n=1 Tax=Microbacterium sp. P07 TaxID=3366952 RepID=UPI0037454AA2